jgi:GH24 family phage-related lysozyme (muramidase)
MCSFAPEWLSVIKGYESLGPNVHGGVAWPYQGEADKPANREIPTEYTCGWGHLLSRQAQDTGVTVSGRTIDVMKKGLTLRQCDELLAQDLRTRIGLVASCLKDPTPNEFGAFLDLVFNAGPECLTGTPGRLHNQGDKRGAALAMLLYRKAQGKALLGLWRRRLTDAVYYLSGEVMVAQSPASELAARARLSVLTGQPIEKPTDLS